MDEPAAQQRQMRDVFWAAHKFLALDDFREREDFHFEPEPINHHRPPQLRGKRRNTVHSIEEIDERVVLQRDHGICDNTRAELCAKIEDTDVLALWKVDPQVCIQS